MSNWRKTTRMVLIMAGAAVLLGGCIVVPARPFYYPSWHGGYYR